jgi:hypothetical protein
MTPEEILEAIDESNYFGEIKDPKTDSRTIPSVEYHFGYHQVTYAHRAQRKLWTLKVFRESNSDPLAKDPPLMVRIVVNTQDNSDHYWNRHARDIYFDGKHVISDVQSFTDEFFRRMGCFDKELDIEDLVLNAGIKSVATRDEKRLEAARHWKTIHIKSEIEKEHQKRLRDYESFAQRYGKAKDEKANSNQGE